MGSPASLLASPLPPERAQPKPPEPPAAPEPWVEHGESRARGCGASGERRDGGSIPRQPPPTVPPIATGWRVQAAPWGERPQRELRAPLGRVGGCGGNSMGRRFSFLAVLLIMLWL